MSDLGGLTVRVLVLHRLTLVAEATAAALLALDRSLVLSTTTSAALARAQLPRTHVLLCAAGMAPTDVTWGDPAADDSALLVGFSSGGPTAREPAQVVEGLLAGASAWLPVDTSPELLLHVLAAVLDGDLWLPPALLGPVIVCLLERQRTGPDLVLSPRESTVLDLVAAGQSNREIAQELHLSTNTVRTHRQRLFRKIDVHSAVQAASWQREGPVLKDLAQHLRSDFPDPRALPSGAGA